VIDVHIPTEVLVNENQISPFVSGIIFVARHVCIARTMPSQDICLSICLSHAGILSTPFNISSKFLPVWFFHTKQDGNILTGTPPPLTGASIARAV